MTTKWTTKRPTQCGWYWLYRKACDLTIPILVRGNGNNTAVIDGFGKTIPMDKFLEREGDVLWQKAVLPEPPK
jgi:hypothetical protein